MPAALDLTYRDATRDDVPGIAALRAAEGWGVHEWALDAVIGRQNARCVVAIDADGELAGVGSGIVYGPLGFIGNMIVAEAHRRRGVGSAILTAVTGHLEAAGCRRLELNATRTGRPLYERHGFESTGHSATTQVPRAALATRTSSVATRTAAEDDLASIVDYDRPRFGGDRAALLEMLRAMPETSMLLAERDRRLVGFAWVRPQDPRIGPMVADDPEVAQELLVEAFATAAGLESVRLNLPPGNRPGAAWLESLGVTIEPWDGRMARGESIERREETIYAMAVGALG
jgi:GNAT superfamily N-acetyltransferase